MQWLINATFVYLKTLLDVDVVPVSDEVDWSPLLLLPDISKLELKMLLPVYCCLLHREIP